MEVPVKIEHGGSWVNTKVQLLNDRLTIQEPLSIEIPFKSIVDVQEKRNILTLSVKGVSDKTYRIASVEKVLNVLKRMITISCSAYRLMAYFMSPAVRGGVMVTNATWEKGAIAVLRTGIWFVNQNKQVCVPLSEVTSIELTQREVQAKQTDVVKIDHLESGDVITSFVLCPFSTLQVLFNFLKEATKELETKEDALDPVASQVAMLVYSGMDSTSIENMLSLPHKQVDEIFDRLTMLGLAEVVRVRKEVQLTSKGVRFISESIKSPNT